MLRVQTTEGTQAAPPQAKCDLSNTTAKQQSDALTSSNDLKNIIKLEHQALLPDLEIDKDTIVLSPTGKKALQEFNLTFVTGDDFNKAKLILGFNQSTPDQTLSDRKSIEKVLSNIMTHESTCTQTLNKYLNRNDQTITAPILCTIVKHNNDYKILLLDGHHRNRVLGQKQEITCASFKLIQYTKNCKYHHNRRLYLSHDVVLFLASLNDDKKLAKVTSHSDMLDTL